MPPRTAAALLFPSLALFLCLGTAAAAEEWHVASNGPPQLATPRLEALAVAQPVRKRLPALPLKGAELREEWRQLEERVLSLRTLPTDLALRARAALGAEDVPLRASWLDPSLLRGQPSDPFASTYAIRGHEARSAAPTLAGLHLWAGGAGYAVGRRSAGYGIECGAALPLDDRIDLTAGYRLAGYALGERLDPELGDVDERIATPFVGFDLRF